MGSPSGATRPTPIVDGSDRKFFVRAAENGNKQALEQFDAALAAQSKPKPPPSRTAPKPHVEPQRAEDPSDQKFYNMAADRKNKVIDLENRAADLRQQLETLPSDSFSGYVRPGLQVELDEVERELDSYQLQDLRVKEAELRRELSALPSNSFSGYARQGLLAQLDSVEQQITDTSIRSLEGEAAEINDRLSDLPSDSFSGYVRQDLEARLLEIDAELAELRSPSDVITFAEFKEATGEVFDQHVEELMVQEGHDRDVAERIVSLQFGASGVPSEALPGNVAQFDPIRVFQDHAEAFDTAKEVVEGDRANPDEFTSLDDLDAIIDNPDRFDPDVVTTAILLRRAADQPGNEEFKAQFEKKSFWEQIKDSPWLDPNSDSLVVNLVRGAAAPGVGYSPAFMQRVVNEGPGVAEQIGSGLYELSPINQAYLAVTDRGQLIDNYQSFGGGLWDWGVDTAKLGAGLTALATPGGPELLYAATGVDVRGEALNAVTSAGSTLLNDPDELAQAVVGWDQFKDDPWRWAGNQAPDIILEILGTKGASKVIKGADAAADIAEAGRVARHLEDIPPPTVDDLISPIAPGDIDALPLPNKRVTNADGPSGSSGVPASRAEALDRLYREAENQGIEIITDADPEIRDYMNHRARSEGVAPEDLHAINLGDTIVVREAHADDVRVLREEMIHAEQQRAGIEISPGMNERTAMELDARRQMIANADEYGLTPEEVIEIEREITIIIERGSY